jgi:hypothetical protein
MLRDAPHQGDPIERSRHDQFLPGFQAQPNANSDFRQAVEKLGMRRGIGRVPELFVHDPALYEAEKDDL